MMKSSFEKAIETYEKCRDDLNSSRATLFSETGENLFSSENYNRYEECVERYFHCLYEILKCGKHDEDVKKSITSKSSYVRCVALNIVKDGFFDKDFMKSIIPTLIELAINGNDDDIVVARKILIRKYEDKNDLIAALPNIVTNLLNLHENSDDLYYIYNNAGRVMSFIGAHEELEKHILFGENHINEEIKESVDEFKELLHKGNMR
jgi:hypothetical protein